MGDEAGFLEAIREDPNDDGARLVYADWLDEQGDSRGEYLRLEHQLAQTAQRLAQLQSQLEPAWLAAVRRPPAGADAVIRLQSGREVQIASLRQWFTYRGLLEGVPHDRMNREMIERLMREERDRPLGRRALPRAS
jgi:uncharacterized protein (TIGR02996 family)